MYIIRVLSRLYGYILITHYIAFIIFSINDISHAFLKKKYNNCFDILINSCLLAK